MKLKLIDFVWLALLAATGFTWWLGISAAMAPGRWAMTALVFVLAWLKGLGVLFEFMELRHAPRPWRWALAGVLSAVICLILLAAALAMRG
jgi:hypothetical protein